MLLKNDPLLPSGGCSCMGVVFVSCCLKASWNCVLSVFWMFKNMKPRKRNVTFTTRKEIELKTLNLSVCGVEQNKNRVSIKCLYSLKDLVRKQINRQISWKMSMSTSPFVTYLIHLNMGTVSFTKYIKTVLNFFAMSAVTWAHQQLHDKSRLLL